MNAVEIAAWVFRIAGAGCIMFVIGFLLWAILRVLGLA